MEWPFGARAGVESVAVAPVSGCFASDVVPSKNWTSPVTPGTVETTVAVNVTDVPNVDGFGADVTDRRRRCRAASRERHAQREENRCCNLNQRAPDHWSACMALPPQGVRA
jgi:hypothetical protein